MGLFTTLNLIVAAFRIVKLSKHVMERTAFMRTRLTFHRQAGRSLCLAIMALKDQINLVISSYRGLTQGDPLVQALAMLLSGARCITQLQQPMGCGPLIQGSSQLVFWPLCLLNLKL